jgi:hypothetical protein
MNSSMSAITYPNIQASRWCDIFCGSEGPGEVEANQGREQGQGSAFDDMKEERLIDGLSSRQLALCRHPGPLSTSPFFMTGWAWGVYGAWRVLRPCTTASRASIAAPPWEPPKH